MSKPPYGISLNWDSRSGGYIATCPSFPDLSAFGRTIEDALREAQVVLDLFIEDYREEGVPLPEPQAVNQTFSGQVRLRLPRSLHADLSRKAEEEGVSLNTLMVNFLAHAVGATEAATALKENKGRSKLGLKARISRSGASLKRITK